MNQKELKAILSYNQETGIFTWIARKGNVRSGSVAGNAEARGYRSIAINRKRYREHRLAWLYVYGEWPKKNLDHINCIRDDNRIVNLREADQARNVLNASLRKDNSSGVKGVVKAKGRWRACIYINRKFIHLGYYDDVKEAEIVMREARIKHHGEFANHG